MTPAAKLTLTAPSGTKAASATGSDGAAAASSAQAPNAAQAETSWRSLTRPRAPVASAPRIDPAAIAIANAV